MKFTIRKSDVTDILSKVQSITSRKSNLAITANILIKSLDNGISFIATNLETGFEGHYPANIEKPGRITVNARKFFEIVQNFPSDDINIEETEKQWIKISCEKVKYNIVGLNPEDFPDIPVLEDVNFTEIDSGELRKMIERAIMINPASDEKRAHITGVYFETTAEGCTRMVATDGRRLSKYESIKKEGYQFFENAGVIIPKKGLSEVSKLLDGGRVGVGIKDNYFVVEKDHETVIIGLLEGSFPDFKGITVKDDANATIIDRRGFQMLLKRMSILSTDNYNGATFNFTVGNLQVNAISSEFGESKEDFKIDYKNTPIEVVFNPKFFIDTINLIEEDKVVLNIKDDRSPCFVEGVGDKSFLSVLMPMSL